MELDPVAVGIGEIERFADAVVGGSAGDAGGVEPNDRRYDEKVARKLRQLKAMEMDALLRDGESWDD